MAKAEVRKRLTGQPVSRRVAATAGTLFKGCRLKRVHFIGICGTAMAAVAVELRQADFEVTGSDSGIYPPASSLLQQHGISFHDGYHPDHIPSDALIVVGNAVSRGNAELEAALDRRCPLVSLPELISRRHLTGRIPIVIAGTHGKSTTAAMAAHILRAAGRRPGWLVGGMPLDLELPCQAAEGREFVIEGDEYDSAWFDKRPKFLHYQPYIAVITAVEFDHCDIYRDLDSLAAAFRCFAGLLPQRGLLLVNGDDQLAVDVARSALCKVETYGAGQSCRWGMRDVTPPEFDGARGEFSSPEGRSSLIELGLMGGFNLRNALAALVVTRAVGVVPEVALDALRSFRGVVRRLQLLIEAGGVALWDDFAHHPTAVRETLTALRNRYPNRRIWALFEPRSNTMARRFLMDELIEALAKADRVVVAPIHRRDRVPEADRLDVNCVVHALGERSVPATAVDDHDDVLQAIERELKTGDVLVAMSNGDFGGIKGRLAELIRRFSER